MLEIHDLSLKIKNFKLENINLKLNKKDYLTIIGPTGSGKSILLETIAGFYKPDRGKILIDGEDVTNYPPERRKISIVYQDFALFPHMTVLENIVYGLKKVKKNYSRSEVEEIAERLGILQLLNRKPETLSGGEKQRVAIARALIVKPKILLMDEPFSALDCVTREKLRNMMREIVKTYKTTVVHVTHDFDDVFSLSNKVAVMREGRIVQSGDLEDVFSKPKDSFVSDFLGINRLEGLVIGEENGNAVIKIENLVLRSVDRAKIGERVTVAIRPEKIVVNNVVNNVVSNNTNTVKCKVKSMQDKSSITILTLESGGVEFNAIVARGVAENIGKEVSVSIKPESVKILR